uniref:Uncharacterized protein n=1 Tax=Cannabis sativa TaxID=3483 RepID=A0A803PQ87_CANSA
MKKKLPDSPAPDTETQRAMGKEERTGGGDRIMVRYVRSEVPIGGNAPLQHEAVAGRLYMLVGGHTFSGNSRRALQRVMIEDRTSSNIWFNQTLERMGLSLKDLEPCDQLMYGFSGDGISPCDQATTNCQHCPEAEYHYGDFHSGHHQVSVQHGDQKANII